MLNKLKRLVGKHKIISAVLAVVFVAAAAGDPSPKANIQSSGSESPKTIKVVTDGDDVKSKQQVGTKELTETQPIPFGKKTVNETSLATGKTRVQTAGVNGVKTITYQLTLVDGRETKRSVMSEKVTTAPIDEVTAIGTYVAAKPQPKPAPTQAASNCDPNYSPCVPNVSYDLDCSDIRFKVTVIGSDPHGFDGNDNDGLGCESY